MTQKQNKQAIRLGNFVFRGDDFGIVIKRDETIVGDVWTCGRSSVYRAETL